MKRGNDFGSIKVTAAVAPLAFPSQGLDAALTLAEMGRFAQ
jgi:hypothetical protein